MDHKGPGPFVRDRLLRLGVPFAAYVLLLLVALVGVWPGRGGGGGGGGMAEPAAAFAGRGGLGTAWVIVVN